MAKVWSTDTPEQETFKLTCNNPGNGPTIVLSKDREAIFILLSPEEIEALRSVKPSATSYEDYLRDDDNFSA